MNAWLAGGMGLGAICVVIYLVGAVLKKRNPDPVTGARLFVAAILAQAGAKFGYLSVVTKSRDLHPFKGEDRAYLVIGGFVVIWVAIADIVRELGKVLRPVTASVPAAVQTPTQTGTPTSATGATTAAADAGGDHPA